MKYDFDRMGERRGTGSVKWDAIPEVFGRQDVIPMWIADMDFPSPAPVAEALIKRAEHHYYGYTQPDPSVIQAVVERMQRKFNWRIEPEWVVFTPGVIQALTAAVRSLTHPGDEVILQSPVYYPFYPVVTSSGCQVAVNQLRLTGKGYEMDYDDLERKFLEKPAMRPKLVRVRAIILCNPHNPVGRVWTREEITRMGEIVIGKGATVISDEIHCELLYRGHRHTPFASISKEFEQNSIVCMAPSKTFNLPGLGASSIIIPNKKLRNEFNNAGSSIMTAPNLFGLTALEAAYRHGDEWLDQMLEYLQGNLEYTLEFFKSRVPRIKVIRPEGTYLVWLDCRGMDMDGPALRGFMRERARVGCDDGFLFGPGGDGFQRMNIACPRSLLSEALTRIETAVASL